jgi:PII-like signaling protein
MTLERARVGDAELAAGEHANLHGEAVKLTVYLGRHERVKGSSCFTAVCQVLHDSGLAGATVLLGVDGTRHGERQRARFFARNANVPLMVISVGDAQPIETALGRLGEVLREPLFTVERVRVCKRDGVLLQPPHDEPPASERGPADIRHKLTIIVSEATRHENRPVYLELVRRLRTTGAAGATSLRGIWGFHGDHQPHGDRLFSIRRHVPVVTVVVDTPQQIAALFPIVDELTCERGLVTSELIPASSALYAAPPL